MPVVRKRAATPAWTESLRQKAARVLLKLTMILSAPKFAPLLLLPLAVACGTGEGEMGEMGEAGLQGPAGAQGERGPAGPAGGPQGPEGPIGPQGLPGEVGPAGPAGPEGAAGPQGLVGETGAIGPAGPTGGSGAMGPIGLTGAVGPAGPSGPTGATGAIGPVGATGPAGDTGASGTPGPQGAAGPAGSGGQLYGEDAAVFVGFTTAQLDGGAGGHSAMHAACAEEFTDAHLCHISEYYLSNSASVEPAGGAWIDWSARWRDDLGSVYRVNALAGKDTGRYVAANAITDGQSCLNWTGYTYNTGALPATRPANGLTITAGGPESQLCTEARPLACCASPTEEGFAGFTTASVSGDRGGRALMNFSCGSEFPGSHMCHTAEYYRAHPTEEPPADGAWIDYSGQWRDDLGSVYRVSSLATKVLGRYVHGAANRDGNSCLNWTGLIYDTGALPATRAARGLTMTSEGPSSELCEEERAIACCF